MRTKRLKSWSAFKSEVLDRYFSRTVKQQADFWFRGQRDANWSLQTTLDRLEIPFKTNTERSTYANDLLQAFGEEMIGLGSRGELPEEDDLDLLARHHGLPSMLLDWTRSPYVAAFFAFEEALNTPAGTVAIWGFNRVKLNDHGMIDLIDERKKLWYNPRALEQAGVFMRVKAIRDIERKSASDRNANDLLDEAIIRYDIPARDAPATLRELAGMNITARNLMRDPDGAARAAGLKVRLGRLLGPSAPK